MTFHERLGRLHAAVAIHLNALARGERGQGTVEYVGLILLIAVLVAGVVQASHGFKDTGIAEAVVNKIKGAIDGVSEGR
jgi:Flp pilus assembly pilin Flp